jgi:hypothetical protein
MLDQLETRADRLRHLALHFRNCGRVVGPPPTAHAVGMRHMNRRAQIAVECLHLGKGKGVIERRQTRLGKALRDKGQHGRRFSQNALVGDHGRHPPLGIDGEIFGAALLVGRKVDSHRRILSSRLFQGDVRCQ